MLKRGGMCSGELETRLRKMNSRLYIRRGNRDGSFSRAGIYHWEKEWNIDNEDLDNDINGHQNRLCSVGVNFIPERSVFDEKGHCITRGWREIFAFLHDKNLIRITGDLGHRDGFLDPTKYGYAIIVGENGKQVGIISRESKPWVRL